MTPRPISPPEATPLRIAIVTMDSHLSGVIAAARAALAADHPGLILELHTAERFATDPASLAACVRAIETADIVIATMLFLDDHIRLVRPHLEARRTNCDAIAMVLCWKKRCVISKPWRLRSPSLTPDYWRGCNHNSTR